MKRLVSILKKANDHLTKYFRVYVIALLLLAVVLAIFMPLTYKGWDRLEAIGLSQLLCSILTFFVILYALVPAMKQLRIAEARPKLALAFDESETTEATIEAKKAKDHSNYLHVFVTNSGDAVAKEFQVELDMNEMFVASVAPRYVQHTRVSNPNTSAHAGRRTISFYNLTFPYFVGAPDEVFTLELRMKAASYDRYPPESTITYRIYDTRGEEQGGELKVKIKKTGEA